MHDLAQALRAELAELAVDGHAAADVDGRQGRVRRLVERRLVGVLLVSDGGALVLVDCGAGILTLGDADEGVLGRREGAGQHLQLVGLVEPERERVAARVPLPAAEGDEASPAREPLTVVGDDAARLLPRDEPPDDDRLLRPLGVAGRDLEDVERRRLRPAVLADLEAARDAHVQLQRSLGAVPQIRDARQVRAVLVTHRQVVEQILDCHLRRVPLVRHVRHRQRQPPRRLHTEPRDAVPVKLDGGSFEREGKVGSHRAG